MVATSFLISVTFCTAYAENKSKVNDALVPIRSVFELNNYNVSWQNETKKILISDEANNPKWSFSPVDNIESINSDLTFVLLDEVSYININALQNFDLGNGLQSKKEVIKTYQQDNSNIKIGGVAPNMDTGTGTVSIGMGKLTIRLLENCRELDSQHYSDKQIPRIDWI